MYHAHLRRPRKEGWLPTGSRSFESTASWQPDSTKAFSCFALPVNALPLLSLFEDVEQFLSALPGELRSDQETTIRALCERGLPPAVSARTIATLFGYSPSFVGLMAKKPERFYRVFKIKTGKKTRTIQSPKVALKVIQSWMGYHLANSVKFADHVFGFVPGKNHIDAAKVHCGSKWVLSIDIKNFFPTTPKSLVISSLIKLGYPEHSAKLIANLNVYNGFLSQGSPSSPAISNICFMEMDEVLRNIGVNFGLKLSRYADDITFSSANDYDSSLLDVIRVNFALSEWNLSEEKIHYAEIPNRIKVHGLLVTGSKVNTTKGYRNQIRSFTHIIKTKQIIENKDELIGHINYNNYVQRTGTL
jgi:hypothetical protein